MSHLREEILEKRSNRRVKGFLRAEGKKLVNGEGEEILLTGWGLGNWLLNEGYMWCSFGNKRFDRPRRIEGVIEELTGKAYKDRFYKTFRANYITEADIKDMADLGYNSIRIPMHYRLLMTDDEESTFIEEGFKLIDNCLDWCEKYNLYAFLDLHGAPGGQTGANIDDSIDDVPRLFTDAHSYKQCIDLWKALAERYKDRYIVGGYDLLNEPIRPESPGIKNYDHLLPNLIAFYEDCIAEIRKIDDKHLFSIEGHHWSTDTAVFDRLYDPNMVIHFHRYGCLPEKRSYDEFIALSEKWDLPLWLGETGENKLEWFSAMYPLALELNISYNLWPAKKMNGFNAPYSIKMPQNWDKVLDYLEGGQHPGFAESRLIFDEYLENIKFENCIHNHNVTQAVFRQPGSRVMGIDFDEISVKDQAYKFSEGHISEHPHRQPTGAKLISRKREQKNRIGFDSGWDNNMLAIHEGESTSYSFTQVNNGCEWHLTFRGLEAGECTLYENGHEIGGFRFDVSDDDKTQVIASHQLEAYNEIRPLATLTVNVLSGILGLDAIDLVQK